MYYKRYFGTIQKSAGLPSWVKWTHHSEGKTHCEVSAPSILSLHINVHYKNMKRINELAVEKGIRDRVIIAAGGTQVIPDEAVKTGIDQGFGRDSHGIDVATFLAEEAMRRRGEL